MSTNPKLKTPAYLREIDGWLYDNPKRSNAFDNKALCNLVSLGNHSKLIDALKKELKPGNKVLQFGGTFGGEIDAVAKAIGDHGRYDLVDVNAVQIERMEEKYKHKYPSLSFIHQNAITPVEEKYEVVICHMLLHELPILTKIKVVNNALNSISEDGKVIFIDYHRPDITNPLRYFVRMWNRLYQPFAEKLWDREISSFAVKQNDITWRKTTYFGRMYQKVIAERN